MRFQQTLDPNCDSRVASTIFDVSSPIGIGHHHDRTLRSARNSKNIKIATDDLVARTIPNQISPQKLVVDFVKSSNCADSGGQLTDCVLCNDDPTRVTHL